MTGLRAKDIVLRPIESALANDTIRRLHYSGKYVRNSQVHLGVFLNGSLEGAMQYGPPMDRSKLLGMVTDTPWNGMLELNRMAFSEVLPPNSESRAIAVGFRLLRRYAAHVKWVVTFADATQCGDGTIYRAAGLFLTGIRTSRNLARLPGGTVIHKMTLESGPSRPRPEAGGRSYYEVTGGRYDFAAYVAALGGAVLPGYQLRYVGFVDPSWRDRLAVPVLPYSTIAEVGASMYKGRATPGPGGAVVARPPSGR